LINTYPDSDIAADAVFELANSFYLEGGTDNLIHAEDEFKNFIIFYPTHPKAPDAQLKVIALNDRMMQPKDREQLYAHKTLREIQRFRQLWPNSKLMPIINKWENEAKNRLAEQDLMVGEYYREKGNLVGALQRYQDIQEKYKDFYDMDEVLFRTATSYAKVKRSEEAIVFFNEIARGYSFSKFYEEAKRQLIAMGNEVPPIDAELDAKNKAKVKPSDGFPPWNALVDFAKAVTMRGTPDPYNQIAKIMEAENRNSATPTKAPGAGEPGDGITGVIEKTGSSGTIAPTATSNETDTTNNNDESKASTRYSKKQPK
jgi:outer membrane assembly lipoprotein YfiO